MSHRSRLRSPAILAVVLLFAAVVGGEEPAGAFGAIDSRDATLILQLVAGLISTLPP